MIEDESTFTDLLPKFDDPESPDRPGRITRPADFDDDDDDERPSSRRGKRYSIYARYFTPEERKMLAAIPDNDVSYEVNLLRSLLVDTFALLPSGPKDQKPPLTPRFHYDLHVTISRVCIIITQLASLHLKLNGSRNETADLIWEALGELDPREMNNDDDDECIYWRLHEKETRRPAEK